MVGRRTWLKAAGLSLASLGFPEPALCAGKGAVFEIRMRSNADGSQVGFDPLGVLIEIGQTVRWVIESNVHTTTAYHPRNGNHSLRIPEAATPWDSGYLVNPGDHFEVTLTVEGVYDYFCLPHEAAGMVGRIIVGRPAGPGTLPFDYFAKDPAATRWKEVPSAARTAFPKVDQIMRQRIVKLPSFS